MNDNSPIERLVEFGLGISMAQQMTSMMNAAMQSMYVPGQTINQPKQWFIALEGKPSGPYTEADIRNLLLTHKLSKEDWVWSTGMPNWEQAKNVAEILKMIIQLPPAL